ncbi:hypothetical protein NC653_032233 [Populus alba x Populus x berolinensis]|uniref:Uncharacterized protein n=1 Tax=Populus alba x Populus x berolinensis TaxID=444605 RepID=A0AAD6PXY3_9ROSI|nr:hypothetical protein NC653_032233 [Populus alba x Populus x berolinensis]
MLHQISVNGSEAKGSVEAKLWPVRIGVEFTWNINDRLLQSEVDSREVASVLSKDTEETTWFRYNGTINELIKI